MKSIPVEQQVKVALAWRPVCVVKKIFSWSEILISSGIQMRLKDQRNQAAEVVDHKEEEVVLAEWCDDEGLDWNDDPQENQGEANDGAQANACTGMNNLENMDETGEGGGVARMDQESQNSQGSQLVNICEHMEKRRSWNLGKSYSRPELGLE